MSNQNYNNNQQINTTSTSLFGFGLNGQWSSLLTRTLSRDELEVQKLGSDVCPQ